MTFNICKIQFVLVVFKIFCLVGLIFCLKNSILAYNFFIFTCFGFVFRKCIMYYRIQPWLEVEQNSLYLVGSISAWGMYDFMVPMDQLCYVLPGCVLYVCVS